MKDIGLKSYQDIKTPKEWDEPSIDDYWEMFWSKYDPKSELSDDDAETVRHWWYEFKGGTGCDWDDGLDTTLEEMKEELKDLYERRGVHSCENCGQCVNGVCQDTWKSHCRTGNNDDYTMYDHWRKREKMISTKQNVDFALYHKKQLIRFCKKFHKDCYRLVGQKMALKDKVADLEQQIEKLKADLSQAIEVANRWEETETFSVLNRIYNDNFEVTTSVSN